MERFTKDLLGKLHLELQRISNETENQLQHAERSFYATEEIIKDLKEYIKAYEFKDDAEEIKFFKEIKPMFLKELIYFSELYYIEANKPVGSRKLRKRYYQRELDIKMNFFDQHRSFFNYCQSNKTDLDSLYFLRRIMLPPVLPISTHDIDDNFSTAYSNILGKFQAYESISHYLQLAITGKATQTDEHSQASNESIKLTWNGSQASFGEWIIATYYSGAVNYGKGGLTQFAATMETIFNKRIGSIHRMLYGNSIRKKDRTPFLNYMIEVTNRKYDEKDM